MFGAITGAMEGLAEKANDMAEGLVDKAVELLGGETAKTLNETKDRLGHLTEVLAVPQKQLRDLSATAGGMPTESADAAAQALKSFTDPMTTALSGDPSALLPSGAACFGSCWANSVKNKLTAFSNEVGELMKKVTGENSVPNSAVQELKSVKDSIDGAARGLGNVSKVVEDTVDSLRSASANMDKMQNLGQTLTDIEANFGENLANARGLLEAANTSVTNTPDSILNMVKTLADDVETFKMKAPQKISRAFKPPTGLCCLGCGKVGSAQQGLEDGLNTATSAVDLGPMIQGVEGIKESLKGLDLRPATSALQTVEDQFKEILKPAKEVAEQAAMAVSAAKVEA